MGGLLTIGTGDENRKSRIIRRLLTEMGTETDARYGIHQVAEVDALVGAYAGKLPDGLAFGPFSQGLGAPLVGDLEGCGHILLKPLHESAQEVRCLGFVGGLGMARSCGCKVNCRREITKGGAEFLVRVGQAQE